VGKIGKWTSFDPGVKKSENRHMAPVKGLKSNATVGYRQESHGRMLAPAGAFPTSRMALFDALSILRIFYCLLKREDGDLAESSVSIVR
jgi:hypothetical protein